MRSGPSYGESFLEMIAKIKRGGGFRGLFNYLLRESKLPEIVGGNCTGRDVEQLVEEFAYVRTSNPEISKPVLHCSLSLEPGETLSPDRWAKGAQIFMKHLGLSEDRPWAAVRHKDKDHDHIHIVTSRVDYTGSVWYGSWQVKKAMKAKQAVEEALSLNRTPIKSPQVQVPDAVLRRVQRQIDQGNSNPDITETKIPALIERAITCSNGSPTAFEETLSASGVLLCYNQSEKTGRISGVSFSATDGKHWVKGSSLGRAFSWSRISSRISESSEPTQSHEPIDIEIEPSWISPHRNPARRNPQRPNQDPRYIRDGTHCIEPTSQRAPRFPYFAPGGAGSPDPSSTGTPRLSFSNSNQVDESDPKPRRAVDLNSFIQKAVETVLTFAGFITNPVRGGGRLGGAFHRQHRPTRSNLNQDNSPTL